MKTIKYHALRDTLHGIEQILVTRRNGRQVDESHVAFHGTFDEAQKAMTEDNAALWRERR